MLALARRLFDAALSLASPPRCMACDAPSELSLCDQCGAELHVPAPRVIDGMVLHAASTYVSPIDGVIQRFKYGARPDLARGLASLFESELGRELELETEGALLVPVPLHSKRLAERGYNQSALLAAALARRFGARSMPRLLARDRDTPKQATLRRAARLENVAGAFRVRAPGAVAGKRVVVVDDVVTTGATAIACARALSAAGAHVRGLVAVASTEPGSEEDKIANPPNGPIFLAHTLCGIGEKM